MSTPLGSSQFFSNVFQEPGQSLRFEDGDSAYLSRTPASAGNRKIWTWSGWVKLGNIGTTQWLFAAATSTADYSIIRINANNTVEYARVVSSALNAQKISSNILRDPSAWYHIVVSEDCTGSVAQIYVNGSEVSYGTNNNPTNVDGAVNNTGSHIISGPLSGIGSGYVDGYLANVCFIDGQALDPTSFGEYDGTLWKPKSDTAIQSLTFGTNGFYLNFEDSSVIGDDTSGNSNDWTANNLVATDVVLDSPVTGGNFATLNPLDAAGISANFYLHEGNLAYSVTNNSAYRNASSTFFPEGLKGYYEFSVTTGTPNFYIGMYPATSNPSDTLYTATNTIQLNSDGTLYNGLTTLISSMLSAFSAGDVGMIAFDFTGSSKYIWFGKNGSWGVDGSSNTQDPAGGNNPAYTFTTEQQLYFASNTGSGTQTIVVNFGQDSSFAGNETPQGNTDNNGVGDFYYAPPSGFLALKTGNLPAVTITAPDEYFNTVLYTGTGTTDQSITGVGFQPDFTWIKSRSNTYYHWLSDAVRGAGKALVSNTTDDEYTTLPIFLSFDSDGFTVDVDTATANNTTNGSGATFVAWNWLAGNGTSSIAVDAYSTGVPSIASTVSVNTTSGFSIITYTGDGSASASSVGHGLSQAPDMVILKDRGNAVNWFVWHNDGTTTRRFEGLNTDSASASPVYYSADADTINWSGSTSDFNGSSKDYVMYAFHSVEGYSKMGSYTGNGSSDGTFVHCGFRPSWILIKRSSNVDNWFIWDSTRDSYNLSNSALSPSLDFAESSITGDEIDILSSGFKLRTTNAIGNASGNTYVFLAFAEAPFKSANAR